MKKFTNLKFVIDVYGPQEGIAYNNSSSNTGMAVRASIIDKSSGTFG